MHSPVERRCDRSPCGRHDIVAWVLSASSLTKCRGSVSGTVAWASGRCDTSISSGVIARMEWVDRGAAGVGRRARDAARMAVLARIGAVVTRLTVDRGNVGTNGCSWLDARHAIRLAVAVRRRRPRDSDVHGRGLTRARRAASIATRRGRGKVVVDIGVPSGRVRGRSHDRAQPDGDREAAAAPEIWIGRVLAPGLATAATARPVLRRASDGKRGGSGGRPARGSRRHAQQIASGRSARTATSPERARPAVTRRTVLERPRRSTKRSRSSRPRRPRHPGIVSPTDRAATGCWGRTREGDSRAPQGMVVATCSRQCALERSGRSCAEHAADAEQDRARPPREESLEDVAAPPRACVEGIDDATRPLGHARDRRRQQCTRSSHPTAEYGSQTAPRQDARFDLATSSARRRSPRSDRRVPRRCARIRSDATIDPSERIADSRGELRDGRDAPTRLAQSARAGKRSPRRRVERSSRRRRRSRA